MSFPKGLLVLAMLAPVYASAQTPARSAAPKVGPPRGTVIIVGGGSMGPEIYSAFIQAAGGPDALIIDVPTAGGAAEYVQDGPSTQGWKRAGAKNVYVLHTTDRKLADSDSFVAILKQAGGVWFGGGRHYRLVDSYAGTKTEQAFRDVLARGGVVGGSSAGASILGDVLVRGAPSNNNFIMYYPGYVKGFAYLRDTGIDQHVIARERLPDLADSIVARFPNVLGISEDEGTAWVVKGDTGTIIGRSKGFVYGGKDNDEGKPFLTLLPGDRYDLAARRVIRRAVDDSPVKPAFIDSLFEKYNTASSMGATVLVASNGNVFIDRSYGIAPQAKYMPTTTVPQFPLGSLQEVFTSICAQLPEQPAGRGGNAPTDSAVAAGRGGRGAGGNSTPLQNCVSRRVAGAVGMQKTSATAAGEVLSNVDALYRLALGLENPTTFSRESKLDVAQGWKADTYRGTARLSAYGTAAGKRHAFVRIPEHRVTIIILTNDGGLDAKALADRITDRLLGR
ncbi:MAG: Type 1 glutamine amidotransferase-like domain-containing protein [Gemmatimonadota bacterium]